jgi:hypothetical protein
MEGECVGRKEIERTRVILLLVTGRMRMRMKVDRMTHCKLEGLENAAPGRCMSWETGLGPVSYLKLAINKMPRRFQSIQLLLRSDNWRVEKEGIGGKGRESRGWRRALRAEWRWVATR